MEHQFAIAYLIRARRQRPEALPADYGGSQTGRFTPAT